MTEGIITSIISASGALIVALIGLKVNSDRTISSIDKSMSLLELKISVLSDRVDKHNSLIERTYKLEEQNAVQQAQIDELREERNS